MAVQVDWKEINGKLVPRLIYDKPLLVNGNEIAGRLLAYMKELHIKTTNDMNEDNIGTDRII